jgi:DNA polymerase (family 10)
MDKTQVIAVLNEIAMLLELQGESSFRANAYRNGARALELVHEDLADLIAQKKLQELPGIGESLAEKISTLVQTGSLDYYEDLKAKTPTGLYDLLKLPGMGPKKVKLLYEQLEIDSLEKLKKACESGQVAELKGFGAKTQQKILEGLAFLDKTGKRFLISDAAELAEELQQMFAKHPAVRRFELCGSLRRRKETVADLDLLTSSTMPDAVMDTFVQWGRVAKVLARGETKASVMLHSGMQVDLRVVPDAVFPFALHYFTGSKEHNILMRQRAIDRGLKLNEYGLANDKKSVACKDESDLFAALGLDYIPPELREATGEIAAAEKHQLPKLISLTDLQGTFHNHTNASDGSSTLAEMAEAARAMGFHYLGIGDHSESLKVAHGLSPARVRRQWKEIDELNKQWKDFRLLKGTECDILPDGSLDFDDELLAEFDYVVASVHTNFGMGQAEMTQRILKAIRNPYVTILGHATGRLLLKREGYKVDVDAVINEAAENGTIIEINAQPLRLDLNWLHCKQAKELGVKFAINPDAHHTSELAYLQYGIDVARRAWLTKEDVINTLPLSELLAFLAKPKSQR